jgi:uncharacterized membrane protein YbhN (UPF0104 family)
MQHSTPPTPAAPAGPPSLIDRLQPVALLLIAAAGAWFVWSQWPEFAKALSRYRPVEWLWIFAVAPVVTLSGLAAWRTMTAGFGYPVPWRTGLRVWFLSQIASYLPGTFWYAAGRVLLAARVGVPPAVTGVVTVLEAVSYLGVGFALSLAAAPLLGVPLETGPLLTGSAVVGGLVAAAAAAYAAVPGLRSRAAMRWEQWRTLSGGRPLRPLAAFAGMLACHTVDWLLSGLCFVLIARAGFDIPPSDWPAVAAAHIAAALGGVLAFLVPMGVGAREIGLVMLLPRVPSLAGADPVALTALALVARVVFTLWDGVQTALVLLITRGGTGANAAPDAPRDADPAPAATAAPAPAPAIPAERPSAMPVLPATASRSLVLPLLAGLAVPAGVYWLCRPPDDIGEVLPQQLTAASAAETSAKAPGEDLAALAAADPLAFLDRCVARYDAAVRNYAVTLDRHERVAGKLKEPESIDCLFRESPFSLFMGWRVNPLKADKVLYIAGRNGDQLMAHPAGIPGRLIKHVLRAVDDDDVKATSRYTVKQFGFRQTLTRLRESFAEAAARGDLRVTYLGVQTCREADGRECHVLRRFPYARPEADGVAKLTIWIDRATLLPLRTELRGEHDELIGDYVFRNLRLNLEGLGDADFEPGKFGM